MAKLWQALALSSTLGILASPLDAQAAANPAAAQGLRCTGSELSAHPFPLNGLTLTVQSFQRGGAITYPLLVIQLENRSEGFLPFSPEEVAVVDRDGAQTTIALQYLLGGQTVPPAAVRLAPGAHMKLSYHLNDKVALPAKLFLRDRLVAEITE